MITALWLALAGCSGEPATAPISKPIDDGSDPDAVEIVEIPAFSRPDGRAVWRQSELGVDDLPGLGLDALAPEHQERALYALNSHVAPCLPCIDQGDSVARCLVDAHPDSCDNLPALGRGVVALAATGADAQALSEYAEFSEPWVPIDAPDAPVRNADAPVMITAVVDYQSPFCARAAKIWGQLEADFPDEVGFQVVHAPELERHPRGEPAARAAIAAQAQGKFWALHDLMLQNYNRLDEENLTALAEQAGLDMAAWQAARAEPAAGERVLAEVAAAEGWGVRSAPTIFVDGYTIRGAQPAPEIARLVRLALDLREQAAPPEPLE